MKKINLILLAFLFIGLSCGEEKLRFPTNKRYWTPEDYTQVVRELKYGYKGDEKRPTLSNPETRVVVEKLTDHQNFKVVLTDSELGLNYKNDMATAFFGHWRDMNGIYKDVDRKDKYLYEKEMLKVWHFGLDLQQYYFKLGNDQIISNSDDSDSRQVERTVQDNVNTMINNYGLYLDEVNRENYYSPSGLKLYVEGIDVYFKELVASYPKGNYAKMLVKIDALLKKSNSDMVKSSLENLKSQIQKAKASS
jgi:hypothetical protein